MGEKLSFGNKLEGIQYKVRPGVYGILLNRCNRSVAAVKTPNGNGFLPGGGIEAGESHERCLKRECLEEIGYAINLGKFIGRAKQHFYSQNYDEYLVSDAFFYFVNDAQKADVPTENGHELIWLPVREISARLFHEHQAWAVERAVSSLDEEH